MTDIIIAAILLGIVGAAIYYIVKAKKAGVKCIGCPAGDAHARKCNGHCGNCSGGCGGGSRK